jgi:hypothetical protein
MSPKATFPHQNRTEVNKLSEITKTNITNQQGPETTSLTDEQ